MGDSSDDRLCAVLVDLPEKVFSVVTIERDDVCVYVNVKLDDTQKAKEIEKIKKALRERKEELL